MRPSSRPEGPTQYTPGLGAGMALRTRVSPGPASSVPHLHQDEGLPFHPPANIHCVLHSAIPPPPPAKTVCSAPAGPHDPVSGTAGHMHLLIL